jgi:hypothetical protein
VIDLTGDELPETNAALCATKLLSSDISRSSKRGITFMEISNTYEPTAKRRSNRKTEQKSPEVFCSSSLSLRRSTYTDTPCLPSIPLTQCAICIQDLPLTSFHNRKPTIRCEHLQQACISCTEKWISSSLGATGPGKITCLICQKSLEYGDVQAQSTDKTFKRYKFPFVLFLVLTEPI